MAKKVKIQKAKLKIRKVKSKKTKVKKIKKNVKKVPVVKRKKLKAAKAAAAKSKEKLIGRVEHFFDKAQVVAVSVKAPFKVGDFIHIKGHTTDFNQQVESIQIEHESVKKVKKGDDVGIKVKDFVREHDLVYLAEKGKAAIAKPVQINKAAKPVAPQKSQFIQTSIFEAGKVITPKVSQPPAPVPKADPLPKPDLKPEPKAEKKAGDPYQEKKFFSF